MVKTLDFALDAVEQQALYLAATRSPETFPI